MFKKSWSLWPLLRLQKLDKNGLVGFKPAQPHYATQTMPLEQFIETNKICQISDLKKTTDIGDRKGRLKISQWGKNHEAGRFCAQWLMQLCGTRPTSRK